MTAVMLLTSFALGIIHAFDADHVIAVNNFVSNDFRKKSAAMFGLKFGFGHSGTLLVFAVIAIGFKMAVSDTMEAGLEAVVGLFLIILGVWAIRNCNEFRKGHVIDTCNNRNTENSAHLVHTHGTGNFHRHLPLISGAAAGMAGTAGIMIFGPVLNAPGMVYASFFVAAYGIGVILGMAFYGFIVSHLYEFTAARTRQMLLTLIYLTGLVSIIYGFYIIILECPW